MADNALQECAEQAQRAFTAGKGVEGLAATEKLLEHGVVDWTLVKAAFHQAALMQDLGRMAAMLAQVKRKIQGSDSRLALLEASYHEANHDWSGKLKALHRASNAGADPDTVALHRAATHERLLQPEQALAELETFSASASDEMRDHRQAIRARCLQQQGEESQVIAGLEAWLPQAGENAATMSGYKLLARLYDKQQHWQQAWYCMEQGNALSAVLYSHSVASSDIRWRVEVWHHLYQPGSGFSLPTYDHDGATPDFLIGFPRSGTTLLEQVLDAHPAIEAMEEPPTVSAALSLAVEMVKARAWIKGRLKQPGLSRKEVLVRVFREMANFSREDVARLRACYWQAVQEKRGKEPGDKRLLDKMPLNTTDMAFIKMLFPRARFIVALRHPADVLLSCLMQSFQANDAMANFHELEPGAIFYRQVMALLPRYQQALSLEGDVHFVRYEDLTADFDGEASKLMAFLGLEYQPAQKDYHHHARHRATLSTPSYQGVTQPIYRTAVARWRHYETQLAPIFKHLQAACRRYGYSLESQEEAG